MGTTSERGFTVIEVMLFLAVTGVLAVGILVGSGVSIGQQRYRDSVNSIKSFIQDQYSATTNVANDRTATWACDSTADIDTTSVGAGQARGTSDCMLLGRFVTLDDSGTTFTASDVVGYRNANAVTAASDVLELQTNYRLGISPISPTKEEVAWGAAIVQPKTTNPMPITLLIVRSPLSGSVLTFTMDGVKTNPNALIDADNLKETKNLCVDSDIGTFVGRRAAVQIGAYASNQGAIQIPPESSNICD